LRLGLEGGRRPQRINWSHSAHLKFRSAAAASTHCFQNERRKMSGDLVREMSTRELLQRRAVAERARTGTTALTPL
jgi:hypothetical protein